MDFMYFVIETAGVEKDYLPLLVYSGQFYHNICNIWFSWILYTKRFKYLASNGSVEILKCTCRTFDSLVR